MSKKITTRDQRKNGFTKTSHISLCGILSFVSSNTPVVFPHLLLYQNYAFCGFQTLDYITHTIILNTVKQHVKSLFKLNIKYNRNRKIIKFSLDRLIWFFVN